MYNIRGGTEGRGRDKEGWSPHQKDYGEVYSSFPKSYL